MKSKVMKQGLLLMAFWAIVSTMPTYATDWQAKTDTIWPARHYRELNGKATGSQRSNTYINWSYTEGTTLVYGIHFPTGHVRADAVFKGKSGRRVTFGVRIVHPATGTVVLENSTTSTSVSAAEQRMEVMPDTEMPFDGWYRFELTCPNGATNLDRLNLLLFQRTSTLNITDSEIFMAPSVHLWWDKVDQGAPSGQGYNWTYLEVMYPSAYRQPATYQMAIGTDGMYSGIQMPTRSEHMPHASAAREQAPASATTAMTSGSSTTGYSSSITYALTSSASPTRTAPSRSTRAPCNPYGSRRPRTPTGATWAPCAWQEPTASPVASTASWRTSASRAVTSCDAATSATEPCVRPPQASGTP